MSNFTDEEVINIYNTDYIGNHMGCPSLKKKYGYDFYLRFKKLGLEIRNNHEKGLTYTCDIDYFKVIDTEQKAYWLGFCYADGYILNTNMPGYYKFGISIGSVDYNHLEKFKQAINYSGSIHEYTVTSSGYKIGTKYCRIIISQTEFANNLIAHGCVPNKSNIIEPPIGIPDELIRHFIRGFMDANGSISSTDTEYGPNYTVKICSTESVLTWIQDYLFDNGILDSKHPFNKRKQEHIVTAFGFGGNYQVKRYLDYIYKDATVWLDRKYERYQELCGLITEREANKRINICAYCGTTESSEFDKWLGDGEYHNKILCVRHYRQLRKYGYFIADKSNKCDICGESNMRLRHIGPKYPEYHGKTLCPKHYNQLMYYGKVIDAIKKDDINDESKVS